MRLFSCLNALHASGRLTSCMVASLVLQFLPLLAQRAQRKRESLNRYAVKWGERRPFIELLQILAQKLEPIPEAQTLMPALNAFISGTDTAHLGDLVANLLRALANTEAKRAVAQAVLAVSKELLTLAKGLLSPTDGGCPWPTHVGSTCSRCGASPVIGPIFKPTSDSPEILCGECFIVHSATSEENVAFVCHLLPDEVLPTPGDHPSGNRGANHEGADGGLNDLAQAGGDWWCYVNAATESQWPLGGWEPHHSWGLPCNPALPTSIESSTHDAPLAASFQ